MRITAMPSVFERELYYLGHVKIEPMLCRVTKETGIVSTLSCSKISALALLAQRHGEFVSRDELSLILAGVTTKLREASALNQHIKEIRNALGDDAKSPRYIQTIRGARNSNREITKAGGYSLLVCPTLDAPTPVMHQVEGEQRDRFDDLADTIVGAFPDVLNKAIGAPLIALRLRHQPHTVDQMIQHYLNCR